jgi:hypothetical protein
LTKARLARLTSSAARWRLPRPPLRWQFVLHAKALHGNPYDGHTLGPVIADLEKLTGVAVRRIQRNHQRLNCFGLPSGDLFCLRGLRAELS